GVTLIAVFVGVFNFYGTKWNERFKTFGTIALFIGYIMIVILVISNTWGDMKEVFATGDTSYVESFSWWTLILSGLIYVGYNLAVYQAALFTVKGQRSIKDTFIGGIIAGVLMTVPWFLTYFALMSNYAFARVSDADVPWIQMLDGYGIWDTILFGLVVG